MLSNTIKCQGFGALESTSNPLTATARCITFLLKISSAAGPSIRCQCDPIQGAFTHYSNSHKYLCFHLGQPLSPPLLYWSISNVLQCLDAATGRCSLSPGRSPHHRHKPNSLRHPFSCICRPMIQAIWAKELKSKNCKKGIPLDGQRRQKAAG